MLDSYLLYTDLYELTMADGYLQAGMTGPATFDYFFREAPFDGNYAVFAGLKPLEAALRSWHLAEDPEGFRQQIETLAGLPISRRLIQYLLETRIETAGITMRAVPEGSVVFPLEPLVSLSGPLPLVQLLESLVLNLLNFQTLIATKAHRMRQAAGRDITLLEFGLRRAQGHGSLEASRAAYIGGFDATSHVEAGRRYGIPCSGTHAHAWVMVFDDELTAFRTFCRTRPPEDTGLVTLLIDTYHTLESGLPAAITVIQEEIARRDTPTDGTGFAVRIDSGDVPTLCRNVRHRLDEAGLPKVRIVISGDLDEHLLHRYRQAQVPFDAAGVGTHLVTGNPQPALGGVYKLVRYNRQPRMKISDDKAKRLLPGFKNLHRLYDRAGIALGDLLSHAGKANPPAHAPYHQIGTPHRLEALPPEAELEELLRSGIERPLPEAVAVQQARNHLHTTWPSMAPVLESGDRYPVYIDDRLHHLQDELSTRR